MASRARRAPIARGVGALLALLVVIAATFARVDASTSDARVLKSALSHRKLGPEYATPGVRQVDDERFWSANTARESRARAVTAPTAAVASAEARGGPDASARSTTKDSSADEDEDEPVFRDASDRTSGEFVGTYETCDTCELCALGDVPAGVALTAPKPSTELKPTHCKLCYGCNVILERIQKKVVFNGLARPVQLGASSTAVFKAKVMRDEADGGGVRDVFVKAWCGLKGKYRHLAHLKHETSETCSDDDTTYEDLVSAEKCQYIGMTPNRYCNQHFLNAIDKITVEAGLGRITPRTWTFHAKTYTPWDNGEMASSGVKQDLLVQVYDTAPGVSLESLGAEVNNEKIDLINSGDLSRIKDIALYELLTSQRDRHGQNVFFDESGDATVIDNESSMLSSEEAGLNTMFIPGGQKYETYRVGYEKMTCSQTNTCETAPVKNPTMGILLDYRCYVDGGYIGKNYSPTLTAYLEKLEGMSAKEIQDYYLLSRPKFAEQLKERAHDMLHLGFEGAVKKLYAGMRSGHGTGAFGTFAYDIAPPCCGPSQCTMITDRLHAVTSCVGKADCTQTYTPEAKAWIGPNTQDSVAEFLEIAGVRDDARSQIRDEEVAAIPNVANTSVVDAPAELVSDTSSATAITPDAPTITSDAQIAHLKAQIERMRVALERVRDVEKKVDT